MKHALSASCLPAAANAFPVADNTESVTWTTAVDGTSPIQKIYSALQTVQYNDRPAQNIEMHDFPYDYLLVAKMSEGNEPRYHISSPVLLAFRAY